MLAIGLAALAGCTPAARVQVDRDVVIPMRDGVALRADIYRPARGGSFPVLVFRTPYGKHYAAESDRIHLKAVERGYAVILQDVRGRYASGWNLRTLSPRRRGRVRHDRMGRGPGMVRSAGSARTAFLTRAQCSGSPRWRRRRISSPWRQR